ncbi:MAG TPA: Na+/H+ antiporter subunit E [Kiritimatiellia bacterium]|nr:Na+/H+ antiporter subunit E [Kiritimatiellia bacterium]
MSNNLSRNGDKPVASFRVWITLGAGMFALWFLLVEGDLSGWWFGVPVVLVALGFRWLMPIPVTVGHVNLGGLLGFLPYFIWQSIRGGIDVGWRAVHPKLPLEPDMFVYSFGVEGEGARVFMAQVISLMPGTLACRVGERRMIVHVLSGTRERFVEETRVLERHTARIFGERWEEPSDG